MKFKTIIVAVGIGLLMTQVSFSYDVTIQNKSDTMGIKNGATSYNQTISKNAKKTFHLTDGDNFQIYYQYP